MTSIPPPRTFTWNWHCSEDVCIPAEITRGSPLLLGSICCDRHIANGGAPTSQSKDAGQEFQNRPWLVNRCQCSGKPLWYLSQRSIPRADTRSHKQKSIPLLPDYSSLDLDSSHQGIEVGTVFQKEASEFCSKNHNRLPEISPHPLTQTKETSLPSRQLSRSQIYKEKLEMQTNPCCYLLGVCPVWPHPAC